MRTETSGAGWTYTYHDLFGRVVQTNTQGFGGNWTYKQTQYDSLGRVISVSHPYFSGETVHCTTYGYDTIGRAVTVTEPGPATTDCANTTGGRVTATAYNGLTTTVTSPPTAASPGGQQKTAVKNSQGQVVQAIDNPNSDNLTTSYTYDSFGNLKRVSKSYDTGADIVMEYDIRGRKISMNDPDMGAWTYKYNALGELKSQTDAKGQIMNMGYDTLGRLSYRTTPDAMKKGDRFIFRNYPNAKVNKKRESSCQEWGESSYRITHITSSSAAITAKRLSPSNQTTSGIWRRCGNSRRSTMSRSMPFV